MKGVVDCVAALARVASGVSRLTLVQHTIKHHWLWHRHISGQTIPQAASTLVVERYSVLVLSHDLGPGSQADVRGQMVVSMNMLATGRHRRTKHTSPTADRTRDCSRNAATTSRSASSAASWFEPSVVLGAADYSQTISVELRNQLVKMDCCKDNISMQGERQPDSGSADIHLRLLPVDCCACAHVRCGRAVPVSPLCLSTSPASCEHVRQIWP